MPVVLTTQDVEYYDAAVSLARYANILPDKDECAFFGVKRSNVSPAVCGYIWQKNERDMVSRYLMEAQTEIEDEVGFLLNPQWVAGSVDEQADYLDRLVDEQTFARKLNARWGRVSVAGIRTVDTILDGATVDHGIAPAITDPALITGVATTVTDYDEVRFYFPGSNVGIDPSKITITGGVLSAEIPRCRLVKISRQDNPRGGISYDDATAFTTTVDIKRVYTDTSTNAKIVVAHEAWCGDDCTTTLDTGCIRVDDARLGILSVNPALHNGTGWHTSFATCGCPISVRLYYKAGLKRTTLKAEDSIVRLAHSKMPEEPCGCDKLKLLWRRDRNVPRFLTKERINCPFGLSDGAWTAYLFASSMKMWRLGGTS